MPRMHLGLANLQIELIYAAIIVALCLIIYFKTKELHQLTGHVGIKLFRNTFLFFAIAYGMRALAELLLFSNRLFDLGIPRFSMMLWLLVVSYASTAGIISLALTTCSNKIKQHADLIVHGVTILTTLIIVITISPHLFILLQGAVLIIAIIMSAVMAKKHHLSKIKVIYALIFAFWFLNLLAVTAPRFMISFKFVLYALSIVIFAYVTQKVMKTLTKNAKKR